MPGTGVSGRGGAVLDLKSTSCSYREPPLCTLAPDLQLPAPEEVEQGFVNSVIVNQTRTMCTWMRPTTSQPFQVHQVPVLRLLANSKREKGIFPPTSQ